jgi:copper transport protein
VAILSVVTLALTGLYSALIHVRTWQALFSTTYGRMVGTKSILFAVLVALGAVNLLVLSPQLVQVSQRAMGWLRRTVRVEIALGTLLLLAVGVLMGVSPAYEALETQHRAGFVESTRQDDVQLTIRVAPAHVGVNEFAVDVVDRRPGAVAAVPQVILRFTATEGDMGTTQVEMEKGVEGRYTARGTYLSVAGEWKIQTILRMTGFDDVVHAFVLAVDQQTANME